MTKRSHYYIYVLAHFIELFETTNTHRERRWWFDDFHSPLYVFVHSFAVLSIDVFRSVGLFIGCLLQRCKRKNDDRPLFVEHRGTSTFMRFALHVMSFWCVFVHLRSDVCLLNARKFTPQYYNYGAEEYFSPHLLSCVFCTFSAKPTVVRLWTSELHFPLSLLRARFLPPLLHAQLTRRRRVEWMKRSTTNGWMCMDGFIAACWWELAAAPALCIVKGKQRTQHAHA